MMVMIYFDALPWCYYLHNFDELLTIFKNIFISYLCTQIIGGMISDKFGGKPSLMYGMLLMSLTAILMPEVSPNYAVIWYFFEQIQKERTLIFIITECSIPSRNNHSFTNHSRFSQWCGISEFLQFVQHLEQSGWKSYIDEHRDEWHRGGQCHQSSIGWSIMCYWHWPRMGNDNIYSR